MTNLAPLLQHAIIYGAILGTLMGAVFVGIAYFNSELWLPDYPPDIREKFGPMTERARRQRRLAGVLVFLLLFGVIVFSTAQFAQTGGSTFSAVFLGVFITLLVFNVVDLVILDWLIFNTLRPGFVVLPGTEGMEGYGDYGFHFRAFLKGVVGSIVASLATAGLALVVDALVS